MQPSSLFPTATPVRSFRCVLTCTSPCFQRYVLNQPMERLSPCNAWRSCSFPCRWVRCAVWNDLCSPPCAQILHNSQGSAQTSPIKEIFQTLPCWDHSPPAFTSSTFLVAISSFHLQLFYLLYSTESYLRARFTLIHHCILHRSYRMALHTAGN